MALLVCMLCLTVSLQVVSATTPSRSTEEVEIKNVPVSKKEKSVLQAKLTKLAIQIGYGGKIL